MLETAAVSPLMPVNRRCSLATWKEDALDCFKQTRTGEFGCTSAELFLLVPASRFPAFFVSQAIENDDGHIAIVVPVYLTGKDDAADSDALNTAAIIARATNAVATAFVFEGDVTTPILPHGTMPGRGAFVGAVIEQADTRNMFVAALDLSASTDATDKFLALIGVNVPRIARLSPWLPLDVPASLPRFLPTVTDDNDHIAATVTPIDPAVTPSTPPPAVNVTGWFGGRRGGEA